MGERVQLEAAKARLRPRTASGIVDQRNPDRCGTATRVACAAEPCGSLVAASGTVRLISSPDAAISRDLQEQTKMVLATLMPHEEQVLRLRFGIGEIGDHTMDEIGRLFALPRQRILEIESRALRKLRRPGRVARLRSASRV